MVPLVLTSLLLTPNLSFAQSRTRESVFEKVLHSSAFILAQGPDRKRMSTGSGSFIGYSPKRNPIIVTNYHVISHAVAPGGSQEVRVMFPAKNSNGELEQSRARYLASMDDPARVFRGKVLGYRKSKDLALIELLVDTARGQRVPRDAYPIALAAHSPKPSTQVHTVGNTGAGGMWSYTPGSVRSVEEQQLRTKSKDPSEEDLRIQARFILTTNPTNPGDSGGPLVNDDGELVGVTQGGILEANAIAVFIDIQEVKAILKEYKIDVPRRGATMAKTEQQAAKSEGELPKTASKGEPARRDPRETAVESKMRNARRAIRDKEYSLAESFLKDILDTYDDTKGAEEARKMMEELKKRK